MTRLHAALGALVLGACSASRPASVTVAPVASSSSAPPAAVIEERWDDLGCGVFAKDGPAQSAAALRRCLEKSPERSACTAGSSPDLATLELAIALIDGTGGAVDVPRARDLLHGCFADVSVQAVLEHAARKEKDAATPALDSCDKYAQTTLAMTACQIEHAQTERGWMRHVRRDLPPDAATLFDAATRAYEVYAEKVGTIEYVRYQEGSLRSSFMASTVAYLLRARRTRVTGVGSFVPGRVTSEDLTVARDEISRSYGSAHDTQPDAHEAVEDAASAWQTYRDAELAFYERMVPRSRDAALVLISREHANALCATVPP